MSEQTVTKPPEDTWEALRTVYDAHEGWQYMVDAIHAFTDAKVDSALAQAKVDQLKLDAALTSWNEKVKRIGQLEVALETCANRYHCTHEELVNGHMVTFGDCHHPACQEARVLLP